MKLPMALINRFFVGSRANVVAAMILSFVAACVLYLPVRLITLDFFHDDDARLIGELSHVTDFGSASGFIFGTEAYKFRPMANLQYLIEYFLFSDNYIWYVLYNIVISSVLVFLFLLFFYKKSGILKCSTLALVLISSKFLIYSIWNITGSFEGLSAILFLAVLLLLYRGCQAPWKLGALVIVLLLTNERYLPFCIVVPFFYICSTSGYRNLSCFVKAVGYSVLLVAIYVSMHYVLNMPVIVGTQTDNVLHSFEFSRFIQHIFASYAELFGFSIGPRYLTGLDLITWVAPKDLLGNPQYVLSLFLSFILFCFCFYYWVFKNYIIDRAVLGFNCVCFLMVAAASITFRLELRWLLPSFLAILLIYAACGDFRASQSANFRASAFDRTLFVVVIILLLAYNFNYAAYCRESLNFAAKLHSASIFASLFGSDTAITIYSWVQSFFSST